MATGRSAHIPDDLWWSFRPAPLRWWRHIVLVALISLLPIAAWRIAEAGLFRPNFVVEVPDGWEYDEISRTATLSWVIRNEGVRSLTVTDLELDGFDSVSAEPVEVPGGETVVFEATYRFVDPTCTDDGSLRMIYIGWRGASRSQESTVSVGLCSFARTIAG